MPPPELHLSVGSGYTAHLLVVGCKRDTLTNLSAPIELLCLQQWWASVVNFLQHSSIVDAEKNAREVMQVNELSCYGPHLTDSSCGLNPHVSN